jgi:hypothetical protein
MLRRFASRLRRAASFSARDWGDLAAAQWALLSAQLLVLTRPVGRLTSQGIGASAPQAPAEPAAERRDEAVRLARTITWAARYGVFRPKCLVRSLALNRMLDERGIPGSVIRVGVRMQPSRDFDAHAWVELDGLVLGDTEEHVGTFTPLPDLRVFERR